MASAASRVRRLSCSRLSQEAKDVLQQTALFADFLQTEKNSLLFAGLGKESVDLFIEDAEKLKGASGHGMQGRPQRRSLSDDHILVLCIEPCRK